MNLFEFREQARHPSAVTWDLVDAPDMVVTEQRIEPDQLEQMKAEWLGRLNGPAEHLG